MPLVVNSLGGGHTNTHTHTDFHTETIFRNQVHADLLQAPVWFNNISKTDSRNNFLLVHHNSELKLLPPRQAIYSAGNQHYLGIILYTNQPNTSAHYRTNFVTVNSSLNEPTFLLL